MSNEVTATLSLDAETASALDLIATDYDLSRDDLLLKIVQKYVAHERELREFVQVGIDAADRGELIEQEEMERWLKSRHEERAAAE